MGLDKLLCVCVCVATVPVCWKDFAAPDQPGSKSKMDFPSASGSESGLACDCVVWAAWPTEIVSGRHRVTPRRHSAGSLLCDSVTR